jgi:hypothetical protein
MTTALEGGEKTASRPGRSLPPGKTRYPLYRRLSGLQGLSGQVRKTSPPPGFDHRTLQPVASRYTDYAIRLTHKTVTNSNENILYSHPSCFISFGNRVWEFLPNFHICQFCILPQALLTVTRGISLTTP